MKKVKNAIIGAIIGALVFSVTGYLFPVIYYTFFDRVDYYEIYDIHFDQENYKPCDTAILTLTRKVNINAQVEYIDELRLLKNDGNVDEVYRYIGKANWIKENNTIKLKYKLPCELEEGTYYIDSISSFRIYGIEKTKYFQTPKFNITSE